jgi:hypothetical protein
MTGIEIVARLAQLQKQYDDAHRPTRPLEAYRRRHAGAIPSSITTASSTSRNTGAGANPLIAGEASARVPSSPGFGVKFSERRHASNETLFRGFRTCTCGEFSA